MLFPLLVGGGALIFAAVKLKVRKRRLPTNYDDLFIRYGAFMPLPFVRALTQRESSFNPNDNKGAAWGLMQVTETLRKEYNSVNGTAYDREDLLDPAICVKIACWELKRIVSTYRSRHPRSLPNGIDWKDPRVVGLIVAGWNAGWSASSGVNYVMSRMEEMGVPPEGVNIDTVYSYAQTDPQVSKHLKNYDRLLWWKSVVNLYFDNLAVA